MTSFPDLVTTLAWLLAGAALIGLYLVPRVVRDMKRERAIERAELTSEGFTREGRAVTEMRRGEHVARFE